MSSNIPRSIMPHTRIIVVVIVSLFKLNASAQLNLSTTTPFTMTSSPTLRLSSSSTGSASVSGSTAQTPKGLSLSLEQEVGEVVMAVGEMLTMTCLCSGSSGSPGGCGDVINWLRMNESGQMNTVNNTVVLRSNQSLTLTFTSVSSDDSGLYVCKDENLSSSSSATNFSLIVISAEDHCGFESSSNDGVCSGWTVGENQWSLVQSQKPFASGSSATCLTSLSLPNASDHTYGPHNNIGHYMQATPPTNMSTVKRVFTSPVHSPHQGASLCLSFFYYINASTLDVLSVMLIPASESQSTTENVMTSQLVTLGSANVTGLWTQQSITIQSNIAFQIIFEAELTNCNSTVIIDDITVTDNDSCATTTDVVNIPEPRISFVSSTTSTIAFSPTTSRSPPTATPSQTDNTSLIFHPPQPQKFTTITPPLSLSISPNDMSTITTARTTTTATVVVNQEDVNDDDNDSPSHIMTDGGVGLAIGSILALMAAGACIAAILYRRRKMGKKSTYITFGNPSYSRDSLPANDFGLESPLTLSSNGYTVLA